jgi:hypothetical protein
MRNSLVGMILGSLLFALLNVQLVLAQSNVSNLHRVRKIYIEAITNVANGEKKIEPLLKRELESRGFEIVGAHTEADAILAGEIQAEVILDGDDSVPNKSIYMYQLTLLGGDVVWKGKVKFVRKPSFAEDNEYAAKRIAEKLTRDWQKSAKKAGA